MEVKFSNGASVCRIWSDDKPELLAAFQYETDAINFAKMRLAEDRGARLSNWYVVSNHYSGALTIIRQKVSDEVMAA